MKVIKSKTKKQVKRCKKSQKKLHGMLSRSSFIEHYKKEFEKRNAVTLSILEKQETEEIIVEEGVVKCHVCGEKTLRYRYQKKSFNICDDRMYCTNCGHSERTKTKKIYHNSSSIIFVISCIDDSKDVLGDNEEK